MPDRVDKELRRVTTALAVTSPPKPALPRPGESPRRSMPAYVLAIASFALVLGAGLIFRLVTTSEPSTGIVAIPDNHVANEILEREARFDEVPGLAAEMGFEVLCGRGGGGSVCTIWEDGIAVIIPYTIRDGTRVEVRTPSFDGLLEVPIETGEPVGVRHDGGRFTVLHFMPGVETPFSHSTNFPSS
jgi:hypothetical protein